MIPPTSSPESDAPRPTRARSRDAKHPRGDRLSSIHAINEEVKAGLEALDTRPRWTLSPRAKIIVGASAMTLLIMGTPLLYWRILAWRYSLGIRRADNVSVPTSSVVKSTRVVRAMSPARRFRSNPGTPSPQPDRTLQADLERLKNADSTVRLDAIKDLSTHGFNESDPRRIIAIAALLDALGDKDARVREQAAWGVEMLMDRWQWQAAPFDLGPIVLSLSTMLEKEQNPSAAIAAACALARFMPTAGSISALKSRLKDEDVDMRSTVAVVLTRFGEGDSAVEALADIWDAEHGRYHGDPDLVSRLLDAVGGRIGSYPEPERASLRKTILNGLRNQDRSVRLACARGLAAIGREESDSPPVVSALSALLDNESIPVDHSPLTLLVKLAGEDENDDALAVLERAAKSHKVPAIRSDARQAVARIKPNRNDRNAKSN